MSQGGVVSFNHCGPLRTSSVDALPLRDTHDFKWLPRAEAENELNQEGNYKDDILFEERNIRVRPLFLRFAEIERLFYGQAEQRGKK